MYVDHPKDRPKPTCIIHGPKHSPDEYKVLGGFFSKYFKINPTKEHSTEPTTKNNFGIQQENNSIVQHLFDEIILQ